VRLVDPSIRRGTYEREGLSLRQKDTAISSSTTKEATATLASRKEEKDRKYRGEMENASSYEREVF